MDLHRSKAIRRAFCIAPILFAMYVLPACGGRAVQPAIESVEPTVLFKNVSGRLVQMVDVTIRNDGGPVAVEIEAVAGALRHAQSIATLKQGKTPVRMQIPDARNPRSVALALTSGETVCDRREVTLQPRRHWKVYVVPITHHDLGYTDTIENVMNLYAGFYDDVLSFCEQTESFPEESKYRYTLEGGWSIQHFMRNRPPETLAKLAKYIRQERIEVGALFGNEISALCGHEEQVRLLYPSFRLKRAYGAKILTGSITDVPGLSWGLASAMAGSGVKYFFAGLPTYFEWGRNDIHTFWDESAILRRGRPDAFRWEGPDGQSVLVYYQGSYGFFQRVVGPDSYQEVLDSLPGKLDALEKQNSPFDVLRLIHNGVDNYPPDVRISQIARQWNETWAYPKLIVATNTMFFKELEKQCQDVRTFRGELPHTDYVVGAVSTAKETSINRVAHDKLLSAEKAALIASMIAGYDYPDEKIADAYDSALLYDEHTWGRDYPAGHVQDWAWNEKSHYAYKAAGLADSVLRHSLERIAWRIRLEQEGEHIVVFNPLSFDRTDVVRVTRFAPKEPFDLVDTDTGESVAWQKIKLDGPQAPTPYAAYRHARGQFEGHELFELVFIADAVPSIGYKTYRIVPADKAGSDPTSLSVSESTIENRFFKVTLDSKTGAVTSVHDKQLSRQLVDQDAPDRLNQFVARWIQSGKREGPRPAAIRIGCIGPVCASLLVETAGPGCPQVIQEITLYDRIKRIDFANRVLKDSTPLLEIYFAFPFKMDKPRFRFEASNSVIEPHRDQFPGSNTNYYTVQHWADVADDRIGVTLASIDSHLMEFGGMWPCYVSQAHHGFTPPDFGQPFVTPRQMTKGHVYAFVMDSNFRTNFQPVQQGDMLFRYSMTTHEGDWKEGRCRDFGWSASNPLSAIVLRGRRDESLPLQAGFAHVDAPNVLILTIKRAEDGRGTIIRLIETEGEQTEATVTLPPLTIRNAWRTNLMEENAAPIPTTGKAVTVPLRPFAIATIRIDATPDGP